MIQFVLKIQFKKSLTQKNVSSRIERCNTRNHLLLKRAVTGEEEI